MRRWWLYGQLIVEVGLLRHHAHQPLDPVRVRHGVYPEYPDLAGGRHELGGDLTDEGGLAGAVGPEDAEQLPTPHGQRDVAVGLRAVPVRLVEGAHLHGRRLVAVAVHDSR